MLDISELFKMNRLKKILISKKSCGLHAIFLLCIFSINANENNFLLDSANAAYAKGKYEKAITLYESVLNKGLEAPELYFNLGNAYYKKNYIGLSILNYERAKKLNPHDEDINANLKLANLKIEDKIEAAPQLFLTEWKNDVVYLMNEKNWSILCILLVIASMIFLGLYIASNTRRLKQAGFIIGSVLLISAIITFFIAQNTSDLSKNSGEGIIILPSLTVTGSPDEKSTKLFILHEGTKVHITQENNDWLEIKIANGNVGWVKKQNVITI